MKWTVKRLTEVQTAFLLLTRLPAGKLNTYVPKLTDAAWAFPAVGFVVGGIIAVIYITTSQFMLPSFASAIFALIFGIFCTGAIHEDGLADCADGFGGGQNKDCSNVTDYNKTPFHENVLQTHIGYQGMVKNPYGSVGKDRTCDIWSGWTDMTSIQSAHLGKKMCKGQIGLYSLTVEKNGCDREMVVQSGLTDEYWTFSSTGSDKVLSTIVCITHR